MNRPTDKPTAAPVHRDWSFDEELTEPEGQALKTLRLWTWAQTDPALTARLDAWDLLQKAVSLAPNSPGDDDGHGPNAKAFGDLCEGNAELAAVAVIVAGFIKREMTRLLNGENGRYKESTQ